MRWKLTAQFLFAILIIVVLVIFVNIAILLTLFITQSEDQSTKHEQIARSFSTYLTLEDGQPIINEKGRSYLKQLNGWVQILDENSNVIVNENTPDSVPQKYTAFQLINSYKYYDGDRTTIYVSEFENYSYIVGFANSDERRLSFIIKDTNITSYILKATLFIIIADILVATIIGLLFGSIITKPVRALIERIQLLTKDGQMIKKPKRVGIYKPVFNNLQTVNEQLLANQNERKKLEKMRTEWVSNVTHDLKTPLASIQGYAEFLQDSSLPEQEREKYAKIIEDKSIYMKDLIDDFNLTMRLRNNEMPLQMQHIKMESFIREIVISLLNDAEFEQRSIEFESTAPTLQLTVDQHLIKRALLNFILNAFIHNDEQTTVSITLTEQELVIEDDGKGIAPEHIDQIFERYYRGSNTENIRGTGLGMAIARDIIHAHQFTVSLQSEVGQGTRICIQFSSH